MNGLGQFKDANTVIAVMKNGSKKELTADKIVIAVGGRPHYPNVPGALEYAISSDDIFSLDTPPGKTCVVGAGYIGLECAGFLKGLGFDATILVRSVVLRGFDQEMAEKITNEMLDHGVNFQFKCIPKSIEKKPNGKLLVTWINTESDTEYVYTTNAFS